MIHKKKDFGESAAGRLNYAAGGAGHEHKVETLEFICGTMISELKFVATEKRLTTQIQDEADDVADGPPGANVATCDNSTDKADVIAAVVDWSDLNDEFEAVASFHCGKGEKLFGHYIVSLAPGESLTNDQWSEVLQEYMAALGYNDSCKFCGFIHSDNNQHMHILTCRVKMETGGPLVDDSNDYAKGMECMRKLEKKLGLQVVANPDETWGVDIGKSEFKHYGNSRENAQLNGSKKDWAVVIRARVSKAWSQGKPSDMGELVQCLKAVGVEVKVRTDKAGEPQGISYKASGSDVWIAGSKVKAARLTWKNLLVTEGVKYNPYKHNAALGLPPKVGTLVRVDAFQMLNERQAYAIKKTKLPVRIYQQGKRHYAGFGFEKVLKGGKERYEEMVRKQLFDLVMAILDLLFGTSKGRAAAPVLTNDMDIPDGLEVIRDNVGGGAWNIPEAEGELLKWRGLEQVTESVSDEIFAVHNEWIDPGMTTIDGCRSNDMKIGLTYS